MLLEIFQVKSIIQELFMSLFLSDSIVISNKCWIYINTVKHFLEIKYLKILSEIDGIS